MGGLTSTVLSGVTVVATTGPYAWRDQLIGSGVVEHWDPAPPPASSGLVSPTPR